MCMCVSYYYYELCLFNHLKINSLFFLYRVKKPCHFRYKRVHYDNSIAAQIVFV